MNRLFAGGLLLAITACAPAPAPVPVPGPSGATPGIPAAPSEVAGFPTTPPELGPPPSFDMPEMVERTLSNGLRVVFVPRGQLPIVQAVLVTRGGQSDDPADTPGLAAFTAAMLDEGAGGRSALELADAIEQLGASLTTGLGWDAAQVSLQVLRDELAEALPLMADVVFRPDFPEADVARLREERLTALARQADDPAAIASNAFASIVYGEEHPYGRLATRESVGGIDRAALEGFHERFYRPSASTLVLVGDVDPSLQPLLEGVFGAWQDAPVPPPVAPDAPDQASTRIILVDRPGAAQSEIRIGHPGATRTSPDFYAIQVLNTLLGGSFTSRLNQNLRETHGYTYGASSGFGMRAGVGPFLAGAAVVTEKTDSALVEFFRELNRIRDEPIPADELERAKQFVALRLPQQLETTGQIAGRVAELATYDLPLDYYDHYVQRILDVTAADVRRVATEYVRPNRSAVIVVGDRQVIEEGVRALPVGPVEIRPIEDFVR